MATCILYHGSIHLELILPIVTTFKQNLKTLLYTTLPSKSTHYHQHRFNYYVALYKLLIIIAISIIIVIVIMDIWHKTRELEAGSVSRTSFELAVQERRSTYLC